MNECKVLLASTSEVTGTRILTYQIKTPLWCFWELTRHRAFSFSASSTRAIPLETFRNMVATEPALPTPYTAYQRGMAANQLLDEESSTLVDTALRDSLDHLLEAHRILEVSGLSKQDANILLSPFIHVNCVLTGTEFSNFFKLRANKEARPQLRELAEWMQELYHTTGSQTLGVGEWHTPFAEGLEDLHPEDRVKVSAARCARVSYMSITTGKVSTLDEDLKLADKLFSMKHMSPFEHQGTPFPLRDDYMIGNFKNFMQYRKFLQNEAGGDNEAQPLSTKQALAIMNSFLNIDPA